MDYFYHKSIRNYTIAILDMFSHIQVPRYNSDGEIIEHFKVPIEFGNKDKAYSLSKHDIENLHNGNVNIFPRMALEFSSMSRAMERNTNKMNRINKSKKDSDELIFKYQYNGVAYDFEYNIYIATKTFTDATIIIEQIAPMFRPDITLKIKELDIQDEPTSVPVAIGEFNITLPEELAEDEIRIIEVDFPITVKGTLYLPITEQEVIKDLQVNTTLVETERDLSAIKYGVDDPAVSTASIIDSHSKDYVEPQSVEEIPALRDTLVSDIQHFENSDPSLPEDPLKGE